MSLSRVTMRFEWDENKSRQNLRKHDVRFETAVLVFDDPYAITQRDSTFDDEERWITVGSIGMGSILLVVHTYHEKHNEEVIRIISARAAESHERKALIFPMRLSSLIGAEPKSGSSIGQQRGPSPCGWIPISSNGSKPMAAGIKPKRMGFYATPCFTTQEKRGSPATIFLSGH